MQFLQTRGPPIIVLFGFCLYQRTHNDYVVMPNDWKPKGEVNSAAFLPVMALTAVVFTIISQLRINALNLYLGSIVPSNTMDITSNVFIALARSVKNSEYMCQMASTTDVRMHHRCWIGICEAYKGI